MRELLAHDKGLLAIDESVMTCNQRFAAIGIPETTEERRAYRELLVCTPRLDESISGAILFDETIHQRTLDGVPFVTVLTNAGIIPGIKVDTGRRAMPRHRGETLTHGLVGLGGRLVEYAELGARFAKWRAAFSIGDTTPSRNCVSANAQSLARYAKLCQDMGIVPIVEPEVLMEGTHSLQRCFDVTHDVLGTVFAALHEHDVALEAMLLKPNMVLPGLTCVTQDSVHDVSGATLECLLHVVPHDVAGITFLSGGQSPALASARLNAMNSETGEDLPWPLSFSFGRALQQPALQTWSGRDDEVGAAQLALEHRARCNRAARKGEYTPGMEQP